MCDTMVALAGTTAQGTCLFAKNSDREPEEAQAVEIIPGRRYAPGDTVRATYITIPQVERTWTVLLSRPFWIWGAEMGANEHGVVIGNEAIHAVIPPSEEPGLIGMDLLRLALERAQSAAEAVDVITFLLERHGQGGSCGFKEPRLLRQCLPHRRSTRSLRARINRPHVDRAARERTACHLQHAEHSSR